MFLHDYRSFALGAVGKDTEELAQDREVFSRAGFLEPCLLCSQ